jgi:hypothetical protein
MMMMQDMKVPGGLSGGPVGGEKEKTLRVKRMEVGCIYTYENSIMILFENREEKERNGGIMEEVSLSRYTVHTYGIITVKSSCIINVCLFKKHK